MTIESEFTVASPPEITASGIYDIISKISPFAFDGMNVAMSANFEDFLEKITFTIEYTNEDQTATEAEPFLAMIRTNQDLLAARLAEACDAARLNRVSTQVSLDGTETDPKWPHLILSAGPYNPDEDEDAS